MQFLLYIFYVWSSAVIIGSLIPLFREQTYWLRAWTYARLQMLVLLVLTSIVLATFFGLQPLLHRAIFAALFLCIILCLSDILPFTMLGRKQVKSFNKNDPHISLNMLVGNVLMDNDNYRAMEDKVKSYNPDIVFLVETDSTWAEKLSSLETLYPFRYLLPLEDYNGISSLGI